MSDSRMNIAVSVNAAYIMPLKAMLNSLSQNTDRELHIYLLYNTLNASERNLIRDFVEEKCHGTLYEVYIDDKPFAKYFDSKAVFSVESFYRLLLPYVLESSIEKILWMDADMIVCGNIDDFYDVDMGQHYLCGVPDAFGREFAKRLKLDPKQTYFNSGLLLFNLPVIRRDISRQQIFTFFAQNHEMLRFPDQDVLNCLMGHNVLLLNEQIYNNHKHLSGKITKDVRVIHYIWGSKPWKVYYYGDKYAASCFWKYARQCGYKRSLRSLLGNSIARLLFSFYLKMKPGHLYNIYHKLRYGKPYKNQI